MHDSGAVGRDYVPAAPPRIRVQKGVTVTWIDVLQAMVLIGWIALCMSFVAVVLFSVLVRK